MTKEKLSKHQEDGTTTTKQQVDKTGSWQNSKLTNYQEDDATTWQDRKNTKKQPDKMAMWQIASLQKVK